MQHEKLRSMHCFEVNTVTVSSVRSSKAAFAVRCLFLCLFLLVARLASYLAVSSSVNIAVKTRTPSIPKEQRGALGLLVPRHKRTHSHHFVCAHTRTRSSHWQRRPHSRCDPGSTARHGTARHGTARHSTAQQMGKAADPVTTGNTHALTACVLISHYRISLQVGCELAQFFMVFVNRS